MPDVYQYEIIPRELRVQVVLILKDTLEGESIFKACKYVHTILCNEYGRFTLDDRVRKPAAEVINVRPQVDLLTGPAYGTVRNLTAEVINFFLQTPKTDEAIDVIEGLCKYIDCIARGEIYFLPSGNPSLRNGHIYPHVADVVIKKLNYRFREHGVGYQYESGQIIRVDSQLIHSEVVQPALSMLLSNPIYKGANEEFLNAHEHYRNQKYKECLNDCLKAFESCLKTICNQRGWNYKKNYTANRLLNIVFDKELISPFMKSHFTGLRSMLESGVPTVRNRLAGHGQGSQVESVPESIAAYALHSTAANILLLARANDEKK